MGQAPAPVRARYGRERRVRKPADFEAILRRGNQGPSAPLTVVVTAAEGRGRLGISAPVTVGNSVVRNRARRLVREAYRQKYKGRAPYDIVVSLKRPAAGAALSEIERALDEAISAALARRKTSRGRPPSGN